MTNSLLSNFTDDVNAARVTILHEDLPTALCAKALFDCVGPQLDGAQLDLDYWRFDALRDPALRLDAARAAESSAIIVFSMGARKTLPAEMREWLGDWLSLRQDHPCAFVVLLGRSDGDENLPVLRHLRRFAEKANADFFCEFCDPPSQSPLIGRERVLNRDWSPFFESPKRTDCWHVTA